MAFVIINDKIKGAKEFLAFLKTLPFAKVVEETEKKPNAKTRRAMKEAEQDKVFKADSVEDLIEQLNN